MPTDTENLFGIKPKQTAIILCGSVSRCSDLEIIAKACNCNVVGSVRFQSRDTGLADQPEADFLLFDLRSISDDAAQSLEQVAGYLQKNQHSTALLWIDLELLEPAYAVLPVDRCHFLLDASDVEAMPILAGAHTKMALDELHDKTRRVDYRSLHRISDELAEFARTLAKMADTDHKYNVSDKPVSFRPAPMGGFQPFPVNSPTISAPFDARALRDIIKARRLRERFFDGELFADPAWDILLDLKAAAAEGQTVSVSSLCIAASVPPTTALRWITAMTESGMLERRQDPDDARRVFIVLSDETSAKMNDYFAAAAAHAGQII